MPDQNSGDVSDPSSTSVADDGMETTDGNASQSMADAGDHTENIKETDGNVEDVAEGEEDESASAGTDDADHKTLDENNAKLESLETLVKALLEKQKAEQQAEARGASATTSAAANKPNFVRDEKLSAMGDKVVGWMKANGVRYTGKMDLSQIANSITDEKAKKEFEVFMMCASQASKRYQDTTTRAHQKPAPTPTRQRTPQAKQQPVKVVTKAASAMSQRAAPARKTDDSAKRIAELQRQLETLVGKKFCDPSSRVVPSSAKRKRTYEEPAEEEFEDDEERSDEVASDEEDMAVEEPRRVHQQQIKVSAASQKNNTPQIKTVDDLKQYAPDQFTLENVRNIVLSSASGAPGGLQVSAASRGGASTSSGSQSVVPRKSDNPIDVLRSKGRVGLLDTNPGLFKRLFA